MYGGFLEYYFGLQFSAFWSMHDKTSSWETAHFKMYPSHKKLNYLQKKGYPLPPPPPEKSRTPWQETQVTGNILILWETLSFWKNISTPPPPPAIKKRKSQSTRKRKNITLRKSFNHPKIASTIMKKPQIPHLKILNFSKNSIGKVFNSFEVTGRSSHPPMRKSQFLKI